MHAMHAEAHLSPRVSAVVVSGFVLGISKTTTDAAEHRARANCLKVFLVGEAGLAEMHLTVDDAGQHMQAAAIHALARGPAGKIADPNDHPVCDGDIAHALPVVIDDGSAFRMRSQVWAMFEPFQVRRAACKLLAGASCMLAGGQARAVESMSISEEASEGGDARVARGAARGRRTRVRGCRVSSQTMSSTFPPAKPLRRAADPAGQDSGGLFRCRRRRRAAHRL